MNLSRLLAAVTLAVAATGAPAAGESISLDLNKLEAAADGCRMHLVVGNPTDRAYEKYVLDLVVFDKDGVIARRTAVDVSPVRPSKTSVYAFNVAGLECARFGRVLLNDVTGCPAGSGQGADCVAGVSLSSTAGVELFK